MAFIENFVKLISHYGKKIIIKDKDKAILELAKEVANGGGGGNSYIAYYPNDITGKSLDMGNFEITDPTIIFNNIQ